MYIELMLKSCKLKVIYFCTLFEDNLFYITNVREVEQK